MSDKGLHGLVDVGLLTTRNPVPATTQGSSAKPIRRLTVRHRRMIALYLAGCSYEEIAGEMECAAVTVGAVIRNPTSQALIQAAYKEHDERLRTLVPLSITAIRDGLTDKDKRVKLQAVDRLYRALGKYRDNPEDEETAEDVVRRIIRIRSEGKVEVVVGEERK